MAGNLRYAVGAVLVLAALDAATSSDASAARVGGAFSGAASALQYLISPAKPLVPDRRKPTAGASGGGSSGGGGPIVPDPPVMLPPLPFPVV